MALILPKDKVLLFILHIQSHAWKISSKAKSFNILQRYTFYIRRTLKFPSTSMDDSSLL